jgi:hypothetical protein
MADGRLEKIRIKAYETPDYAGSAVAEFTAQVNPAEITTSYEISYHAAQGAGTTGSRMEFDKVKPGDLTLGFLLDGTGANGRPLDVQSQVEQFQTTTGYSGQIHRARYLLIVWGTLQVRRCVLKSATIAYKLFRPDGVPLRALITAVFTDAVDDQTRVATARDESADLTHVRLVTGRDSLPRLCHEIYGDARLYVEVARRNGLHHFRSLEPGTKLVFPPLEK